MMPTGWGNNRYELKPQTWDISKKILSLKIEKNEHEKYEPEDSLGR